jgi:hypothetical protein
MQFTRHTILSAAVTMAIGGFAGPAHAQQPWSAVVGTCARKDAKVEPPCSPSHPRRGKSARAVWFMAGARLLGEACPHKVDQRWQIRAVLLRPW